MGKLLKFIGWLLGILIVLIIALVILVPMFVDPNEHKDKIVAEVKKATGRDLTIGGDIGLSVFPWLGLELNGLSLSNAPGFGDQVFAAVEHAQVRVNVMPLITKQTLEVDTVRIKGLDLNLAKSKQGVTNWDDLVGPKSEEEALPEAPGEARGLTALTIGGVAIQDANILWDDQSTGEHYEIKDLNLKTGALSPGRPVDVKMGLGLASEQPPMQGSFNLSGKLNANPDAQTVALEMLEIDLNLTGEGLPAKGVDAKLLADLFVNQAADTFEIKNLTIQSGQLTLNGLMRGSGLQSKPVIDGELKLEEFNPRSWLEAFKLPVPQTADSNVLKKLGMSTSFKADSNGTKMDKLAVVLDDTKITGDLEMINTATAKFLFNLDLDKINLDRYLPPSAAAPPAKPAAKPPTRPSTKGQKEEPLFPVEALRKLNLDGNLRIGSMTVNKIHAEAIKVKVTAKDGHLKVDQQVGRFYDGLIKGGFGLDVRGKSPKIKLDQKASRIMAGPLLRDLADMDKLEGSGGFTVSITSVGQTVSQLKRSLNGAMNISFVDGTVKGFNLAKMIRQAKAKLSGKSVAVDNEPEQTDFSELTASAVIRNGVLSNRDLLAKSPYLRVEGAGKVNLVMENLDYTVKPVFVKTPKGQGGEELKDLVGVPIPVRLKGDWADPDWNIDLGKVLAETQKAKLKEKVEEELQEKLPEGLKDKLPGALKGLF